LVHFLHMENHVKTTPKDFFLYLGTMIALYVSVISLLALLFQYINVLLPDALDYRFAFQGYSAGIRIAIASLIVIFPLYLILSRWLNKDLARHPEKENLWIRKWLIYITLFIGSIAILIDLIVLINTFLGGELTGRFLWKVLAILVVVGDVFIYYYLDLKGRWQEKVKQANMIAWVNGIVVLAIIVAGFFIIGSPADQRLYRFDEQKVQDLIGIQSQVVIFWQDKDRLPNDLDETKDPIKSFAIPTDPQTGEDYKYNTLGPLTFELCATFNKESRDQLRSQARPYFFDEFFFDESWEHGEGETCFERTIDPDRFQERDLRF